MDYLYHGSSFRGIMKLIPRSFLNGSNVLYLTDNIPYALFYIWDSDKLGYQRKHVTAYVKNGVAGYGEQFPEQLKTFYSGVSGYLYCVKKELNAEYLPDHDGIYYYRTEKEVSKVQYIPDVYSELLKYESMGLLNVARFNDQSSERQNQLVRMMSELIVKNDFYATDPEKATFYQKYFTLAWEQAQKDIL